MKQHINIIRTKTAPNPTKKTKPEPLDEAVEVQIYSALRTLTEGQGFELSGQSAAGLTSTVRKIAKELDRVIVIGRCAHPHGLDDQQETIRAWLTNTLKSEEKLSFVEWDDSELGEAARKEDIDSGATKNPMFNTEVSMDTHYQLYLQDD